jgi:hypothetical protein
MPNLFPGEGKKLVDEPTDLKAAEATGASPFQPPTPNVSGSSEATAKSSPDFGLDSDDDSLSSSDDSVEPMDIDLDMEAFQLHSDQMKDTVSLSDSDDSVEPMDVDMVASQSQTDSDGSGTLYFLPESCSSKEHSSDERSEDTD